LPKSFSQTDIERHKDNLSTTTLWRERNKDPRAVAELNMRFALPLSVLILALIAVPLSRVETRKLKYMHLLPALLIYIVYMNLLLVGRAWLKQGKIAPGMGLWWVHGLFFVVGLILMLQFLGCFSRFRLKLFSINRHKD